MTWCASPSRASAALTTCSTTPVQGADVVLVGETLVTGKDPRTAVADLVAAGTHPRSSRGISTVPDCSAPRPGAACPTRPATSADSAAGSCPRR